MIKKKYKYHFGLHCLHCDTKIFSLTQHDFVSCQCILPNGVFVDGGFDYFRCGWAGSWKEGKDFKVIKQRVNIQ